MRTDVQDRRNGDSRENLMKENYGEKLWKQGAKEVRANM